jgi:ATP-binding protein involved in chromosome partitioning
MSKITKEIIAEELNNLVHNQTPLRLVDRGIVSSIIVKDRNIGFVLNIGAADKFEDMELIRKKCEETIYNIHGVEKVTAVITNENSAEFYKEKPNDNKPKATNNKGNIKPPEAKKIAGIKKIIAVASGKGGVGKSTISAHLALSLAAKNFKVGLVDADILGPSIAKMMGLSGVPEIVDNKMIPHEKYGVKTMTMGFILGENAPAVWRGPMISKALHQLMLAADWGELDYLIIDMPPGTGDIQLSLCQNYVVDRVMLVSTPQEIALLDVKKAATMFSKLNIPIIGLLENMSYYQDSNGEKINIFGVGACKKFCEETGMKFLGQIPLLAEISASCDKGLNLENNGLIKILADKIDF